MDPLYGFAGVVLLVAGFALIALGGRLHTWPRPSRDRPMSMAERTVLLLGASALLGGILMIGFAVVGTDSGSGGSPL